MRKIFGITGYRFIIFYRVVVFYANFYTPAQREAGWGVYRDPHVRLSVTLLVSG